MQVGVQHRLDPGYQGSCLCLFCLCKPPLLLQLGGSPRGLFGKAMAKNPSANHLYVVWQLMHEASQALPPEEVIALLEEFLEARAGRKQAWAKFQGAIPWTVEQLRAGEPFPEWDSWEKIDK